MKLFSLSMDEKYKILSVNSCGSCEVFYMQITLQSPDPEMTLLYFLRNKCKLRPDCMHFIQYTASVLTCMVIYVC